MKTEDDVTVSEENMEINGDQEEQKEEENSSKESELSRKKRREEDLFGSYENLREKENREREEQGFSSVDQLREMFENYGVQFSKSFLDHPIIFFNSNSGGKDKKKELKKDILGSMDDKNILEWSSEHYKDYIFAVFLSVCILDCQAYEDILQMGKELQDIFGKKKNEKLSEDDVWNYKSRIQETLGVIEYRDKVFVRGIEQEADFLRLPSHEQSGYYIRLFIKEFPDFKLLLGPYLVSKIFDTCKKRRNYLVVGGCTEALANIGNEDVVFFNTYILPLFFRKRTDEADYCLAILLKQMYLMEQNRDYVITCAKQWGWTMNNPHYTLTVLYLCGMVKNQEDFVWGIWDTLLNTLLKEIMEGLIFSKNSYYMNLLELIRSGNRDYAYYKGVIHAFYDKIGKLEKEHRRKEIDILGTLFLLFVLNDYEDCGLSGSIKRRRGMLWVEIMEQMDSRTGRELVFLWKQILKHRQYPKKGWHILQLYLDKYESWDEEDIRKLAFFFYWINRGLGNDLAYSFLKKCMSKGRSRLLIAEKIYERIMEETKYGR